MQIAIISDIHSNLEAFKAVLNKIDSLGIKQIYCLGDIVGYGADPKMCIQLIKERRIPCTKGNHDWAVVSGDTTFFNPLAADAILRTIDMLNKEEIEFLDSLKEKIELKLNGYKIYLVHGSPRDPIFEYVYEEDDLEELVDYTNSDVLAMGHTHIPFVKRIDNKLVINAGAVGQPRTGKPFANFVLLDLGKFSAQVVDVKYNVLLTANKILGAGFPSFLATRLYKGI